MSVLAASFKPTSSSSIPWIEGRAAVLAIALRYIGTEDAATDRKDSSREPPAQSDRRALRDGPSYEPPERDRRIGTNTGRCGCWPSYFPEAPAAADRAGPAHNLLTHHLET